MDAGGKGDARKGEKDSGKEAKNVGKGKAKEIYEK